MSLTINESGDELAQTVDGITLPIDCSFAKVNGWIHGIEVSFEEVQSLCLGMAAENDRLRAKLVAMESQEPVAWANNQGETTINEIQVEYWQRGGYEVTPLYAKPVPADKQERITEQDAREIAISILIEPDADLKTTYIDGWLLAEGITLLNKLNADREQVPAGTAHDDLVKTICDIWWKSDSTHTMKHSTAELIIKAVLSAAPSHSQKSAVVASDTIISAIEYSLTAIRNETAMQVCCGRPGQECCGSPDADWPVWAVEVMTRLDAALKALLSASPAPDSEGE